MQLHRTKQRIFLSIRAADIADAIGRADSDKRFPFRARIACLRRPQQHGQNIRRPDHTGGSRPTVRPLPQVRGSPATSRSACGGIHPSSAEAIPQAKGLAQGRTNKAGGTRSIEERSPCRGKEDSSAVAVVQGCHLALDLVGRQKIIGVQFLDVVALAVPIAIVYGCRQAPVLRGDNTVTSFEANRRAISAVWSVEPSFTTMISFRGHVWCAD